MIKQTVDVEFSTQEFIEMEPHESQRWEGRWVKAKHLRDWKEPHRNVAIAVYPDGRMTSLDGNTRKFGWVNFPGQVRYEVPDTLIAHKYFVSNYEEADSIYECHDHTKASKKTNDKITEAYRLNGLVGTRGESKFTTALFQGASGMVTVMNLISKIHPKLIDLGKSKKMRNDFVNIYKQSLLKLDELFIGCRSKKTQKFPSVQIAACLIFLQKYGVNDERLIDGIKRLIKGQKMEHSNGDPVDGITYILEHWTDSGSKGIYESNHAKIESGESMNKTIYFLESWMKDKHRMQFRSKSGGIGYYFTFFDNFDGWGV